MRIGKLLATAGVLLGLAAVPACSGAPEKLPDPNHDPSGSWTSAPAYLPMFTPAHAHKGAYTALVSPLNLRALLKTLEDDPYRPPPPPGAWEPVALLPSDAFGQTGSYDRWKMAKLYGAGRALVARGPVTSPAGQLQAWTLISPYPDTNLERLEPGTLIVILNLQAQ